MKALRPKRVPPGPFHYAVLTPALLSALTLPAWGVDDGCNPQPSLSLIPFALYRTLQTSLETTEHRGHS